VQAEAGGGSATYQEPNGSYPYVVGGSPNSPPLHPHGTVPVSGGPVTVTLPFDPTLSVTGFAGSPSNLSLGAPLVLAGTIAGGTGPYQLRYSGLPPGCVSANATTIRCTPTDVGRFAVVFQVSDSVGAHTTANATVVVLPPPASTGPTASATVPPWEIGAVVLVAAAVAGAAFVLWRRSRRPA
jgi:hypothetical protein